jgi:hypothetical protein
MIGAGACRFTNYVDYHQPLAENCRLNNRFHSLFVQSSTSLSYLSEFSSEHNTLATYCKLYVFLRQSKQRPHLELIATIDYANFTKPLVAIAFLFAA